MFDSWMVTSPCGDAGAIRGVSLCAFTTAILLATVLSEICRVDRAPAAVLPPGHARLLLGADRLGLLVRGQLSRQIDLTGGILAALDRVRHAGHGIFEDRALEDFLFRRLAAGRSGDRPLHGEAHVVVFGG